MPHDPYRALYLHFPFCASRCAYCDFATRAVRRDDPAISSYVEDMVMQIRRAGREGELASIETVYLGGGTPTHTGTKHLSQVLYALGLTMHLTEDVDARLRQTPKASTSGSSAISGRLGPTGFRSASRVLTMVFCGRLDVLIQLTTREEP